MYFWWRASPSPPLWVLTITVNQDINFASACYFNDPLWDRSGCITSSCCAIPIQPQFYRLLSGPTTSEIEATIYSYLNFVNGFPWLINWSSILGKTHKMCFSSSYYQTNLMFCFTFCVSSFITIQPLWNSTIRENDML